MARFIAIFLVTLMAAGQLGGHAVSKRSDEDTNLYRPVFDLIVSNILASGGPTISIPEVEGTFGGHWLKGRFHTTGGVLSDLSTLRLLGISVTSTVGVSLVDIEATMDTLQESFSRFEFSTRFLSGAGNVTVKVCKNLIDIRVRVSFESGACVAALSSVKLRDYAYIDVTEINAGSGDDEYFIKQAMELAESLFMERFVSKTEEIVHQAVTPFVQTVCDVV